MAPGADPAAGALPLDHLMLGDLGFHRRDLHDLPPLGARLRRAIQASTAPGAASRLVPDHMIGMTGQLHRLAGCPFGRWHPIVALLAGIGIGFSGAFIVSAVVLIWLCDGPGPVVVGN